MKIPFQSAPDVTVFRATEAEIALSDTLFDPHNLKKPTPPPIIRIGMLLPLTGASEKLGLSLQQAALMSLFDAQNPKLVLQFYDTEGTPEGARKASQTALDQGVELIIGPVFSNEVRAIRENTHTADVGVITFSSHPSNLGDGIYTISTLTSQQIEHVVGYACEKGYKRFAILAQDNALGDIVSLATKRVTQKCDATITKAAFYDPKSENMQPAVDSIMPKLTDDLEKERDKEVARLEKSKSRVAQGTPVKIHDETTKEFHEMTFTPEEFQTYIDALKQKEFVREPFEFDALLMSEEGSKLRSLAALLSYYDVPSDIRILGTSQWAQSRPQREPALVGGWFSNLPSEGFYLFSKRYKALYNETPARIVSQAYDAVALASVLAETGDFSYNGLTSPYGFKGVDGLFRLLPNGLSERGLQILGVEKEGFVALSPAREVFDTEAFFEPEVFDKDFRHSPDLVSPLEEQENLVEGEEILVDKEEIPSKKQVTLTKPTPSHLKSTTP